MKKQNKIAIITPDDNVIYLTEEDAEIYKKQMLDMYDAVKPKVQPSEKVIITGTSEKFSNTKIFSKYIVGIDPYQIDNPGKTVEVSIFKNEIEFKNKKENGTK